jgi:DNA-binding MarR family transcriptional regulator/N-acetylglutamate synthase-like GNAT family acetyltransferase
MRRFNRFYTRHIGVLNEGLLESPFSLTEARILYELARCSSPTATEIGQALGLDAGYLSRILRGFRQKGLLSRHASTEDGRRSLLGLTAAGRRAFARLDARSRDDCRGMLVELDAEDQRRLLQAMGAIERLLGGAAPAPSAPVVLRSPLPGDYGWVVERHGAVYAQEYGWDASFEGLVAGIVARFAERHDPERERAFIAERGDERLGCVFLVRKSAAVAKLRLLLVEPRARGLGLGRRLVDECLRFARAAGYRKVTLWTNDILTAARSLYEKAGFRLVAREEHRSFGQDLVGETWELGL